MIGEYFDPLSIGGIPQLCGFVFTARGDPAIRFRNRDGSGTTRPIEASSLSAGGHVPESSRVIDGRRYQLSSVRKEKSLTMQRYECPSLNVSSGCPVRAFQVRADRSRLAVTM